MSGHLPYEELGKVIRESEMCKVLGREEPGTLELKASLRGWPWEGGLWQGEGRGLWLGLAGLGKGLGFHAEARGSHWRVRKEWCGPSGNLTERSGCRGGMRLNQRNQEVPVPAERWLGLLGGTEDERSG